MPAEFSSQVKLASFSPYLKANYKAPTAEELGDTATLPLALPEAVGNVVPSDIDDAWGTETAQPARGPTVVSVGTSAAAAVPVTAHPESAMVQSNG